MFQLQQAISYHFDAMWISMYLVGFLLSSICCLLQHNDPYPKSLLSMFIYGQLIFNEKPKTIIEFGTYTGASALWLMSIANELNNNCQLYTFDNKPEYLKYNQYIKDKYLYPNGNIHIKIGDLNKNIDKCLPIEWLDQLPHPWLIIDDAHINGIKLFEHLDKCQTLRKNDYVIIEDTIPYYKYWNPKCTTKDGLFIYNYCLLNYFKKYEKSDKCNKWMVDTKYCDYIGYNSTYNWNAILRRM